LEVTKSFDVYGIGNALVDVQTKLDEAAFEEVISAGHAHRPDPIGKGNMHLVDPLYQEHLLGRVGGLERRTVSGGSACNTMIGLSRLGCRAKYAGKVGSDDLGAFFAADLNAAGVEYDVPPGEPGTGSCVVLVTPDAQRSMFTDLGISTTLDESDLDLDAIAHSKWVYIEGYLWDAEGPKAASVRAMEHAKSKGVKVAYSYSDSFCVERAHADFKAFTRDYVDLVFCNADEARAFAEVGSVPDAIAVIQGLGAGVAVTLGEEGSIIAFDGATVEVSPEPVHPIDSTGAGDLYAAGVLAGLCQGKSIGEAGRMGSRLAAQVLAVHGARIP
jgi:sugar/nucleoside kinase (ribokinase family)